MKFSLLLVFSGAVMLKVLHSLIKEDGHDGYTRRFTEKMIRPRKKKRAQNHDRTQSPPSNLTPLIQSPSTHPQTPTQSPPTHPQKPTQSPPTHPQKPTPVSPQPSNSAHPPARPVRVTRHSPPNPPKPNHSVANTQVAKTNLTPSTSCNVQTPQQSTTIQHASQLPGTSTTHNKVQISVVKPLRNGLDAQDNVIVKKNKNKNKKKKNTSSTDVSKPSQLVRSLNRQNPPDWGPIDYSLEVEFVELSPRNPTFKSIDSRMGSLDPVEIYRIQNPYLWSCYQLKKEEYESRCGSVEELELWHATDECNVDSIASGNFDWRRTTRQKFGKGVNFSPDPEYANRYCNNKCGEVRALFLVKVIVGAICPGTYATVLPMEDCDTSYGNNDKVYVKYADNEFYPQFVAIYYN